MNHICIIYESYMIHIRRILIKLIYVISKNIFRYKFIITKNELTTRFAENTVKKDCYEKIKISAIIKNRFIYKDIC